MNAIRPTHLTPTPTASARWLGEAWRIASLSPEAFGVLVGDEPDPARRRAYYRARFRFHVREFSRFCLPEVTALPWNDFHRDRLDAEKIACDAPGRQTSREADAAPRGIAKSTTEKIDALHDVCYGLERFVLVLSAGKDDAMGWADTIRGWAEQPTEALDWLYGPFAVVGGKESFRVAANGANPKRFPSAFVVSFACRSFRSKVRGINDATARPSKVIVDDGEDRARVNNPRLRDEDRKFTTDDVLKVAPRQGGTRFRWVGTVLHRDAQLSLMIRGETPLAGWRTRLYRAVESWPANPSLWDRYTRIYTDLRVSADPAVREAAAAAFYAANRAAMDEGVKVLDPHALPIDRVYRLIADEGRASVLRELNNDPIDPSRAAFDSSKFRRCKVDRAARTVRPIGDDGRLGPVVRLDDCRLMLRWDPTPAQSEAGDYAAIVLLARDPDGYDYVIDAWLGRESKAGQYARLWAMAEGWGGVQRASVESNGFQVDDFRHQVAARREAGQWWQLQLESTATTTDKVEDICSLDVPVQNGWLLFADHLPRLMFDQFDAMTGEGSSTHDDGPDAVARGRQRIGGRAPSVGQNRLT